MSSGWDPIKWAAGRRKDKISPSFVSQCHFQSCQAQRGPQPRPGLMRCTCGLRALDTGLWCGHPAEATGPARGQGDVRCVLLTVWVAGWALFIQSLRIGFSNQLSPTQHSTPNFCMVFLLDFFKIIALISERIIIGSLYGFRLNILTTETEKGPYQTYETPRPPSINDSVCKIKMESN